MSNTFFNYIKKTQDPFKVCKELLLYEITKDGIDLNLDNPRNKNKKY